MICEGNALADPRNGDRLLTVVPSSPRIRTCRSGRVPKQGFTELEPTDDGKYIVTASWIQHIRQAFLDGDLDPLLELVAIHGQYGDPEPAAHQRSIFHGNLLFSPHLAALLTDVLTGKIKRPRGQGAKKIHRSRAAIMAVGQEIDRLRAPSPTGLGMSRMGAIATVADGSPAIEGLEGLEGLEIPKVTKNRIEETYEEFERLTRNAKKPTTTKHSRQKRSPRTTRSPST